MANLKCPCCKKDVLIIKNTYCSIECRKKTRIIRDKTNRYSKKNLIPNEKCLICQNNLPKGKSKYCSRSCRNKQANSTRKSYVVSKQSKEKNFLNQKERVLKTKLKLIKLMGNSCESCGYCKNAASLVFHHKNPKEKSFGLSGICKIDEKVLKELAKCSLLCHNCHDELHNPRYLLLESKVPFCFPC